MTLFISHETTEYNSHYYPIHAGSKVYYYLLLLYFIIIIIIYTVGMITVPTY
jgi:hypothetical protein